MADDVEADLGLAGLYEIPPAPDEPGEPGRKLLMPVCRDCGVLVQYESDGVDWGLQCPKCEAFRCDVQGLQPTEYQRAWRAERQAAREARA